MNRDVIAVVLNYRRPDDTIRCVGALKGSRGGPFRIVVVDNHSADGSVEKVRAAHPDVEVLEREANGGYTGGMNAGFERALSAGAEFFLMVNSDTVPDPDFVDALVGALRSRPRAAAATGTIRHAGIPGRAWYAGGRLRRWRASAFTDHRYPADEEVAGGRPRSVTFISGCAFLVRAEAVRTVGPFDDRFFMYVEDVELFSRMLSAGYELLYVPGAMIDHRTGVETLTPARLYYGVRNRFLFLSLSTTGAVRLAGWLYLSAVSAAKMAWWLATSMPLAKAAWTGYRDYRAGSFGEGSAPVLGAGAGAEGPR